MRKVFIKLLTVMLVAVISVAMLSSCKPKDETMLRDDFVYRNYGMRYDDVTFNRTSIDPTIAAGNDINAILHFLEVIDANLIAANYLASASTGGGTASSSLFSMEGALEFGDIYVRENGAFYSQSVARVTRADSTSPVNLLSLAQALLDQADRKYSADGQTFYVQKVNGNRAVARMIEDYPYGSAAFSAGKLEVLELNEYKEAQYVKNTVGELSHFVFAEDTILHDTINIQYANGLYEFTFDVNLEDEAAREKATEFARANMREASSSDDLEYGLFRVTIEMYDNGLIAKYTKEESWLATLSVGPLSPNGASHSSTSIYYSWDPADCTFAVNNIDISWAQ